MGSMDNVLLAYLWAAPLLVLIGVAWAPFAVVIGLMIGRKQEATDLDPPSTERFVAVTALHSVMMVFPWVYLFARWIGKPIPHRFIKFSYAMLYVRWFFSPIWVGLYFVFQVFRNYFDPQGQDFESSYVGFFITVIILAGLNWYVLFRSLTNLKRQESTRKAQQKRSFPSHDFYYLKPIFVWLITDIGITATGFSAYILFWALALSTAGT